MGLGDFAISSVFFIFSGFSGLSGRIKADFFLGAMSGFAVDLRGGLGATLVEVFSGVFAGFFAGFFAEAEIGLFTGIEREVGAAWRTSGSLEDECRMKSMDLP